MRYPQAEFFELTGRYSGLGSGQAWVALASATLALLAATAIVLPAQTYTVLYSFTGGTDGGGPSSNLIPDKAGNPYGTTGSGGIPSDCPRALLAV